MIQLIRLVCKSVVWLNTFFKTSLCSTDQRQSWLHRKYSTNTSSPANFHTNTSLTGNTSNCLLSHNPLKVYWAWRNLSTTEVKIFVLKSVPSLLVNSPAIIWVTQTKNPWVIFDFTLLSTCKQVSTALCFMPSIESLSHISPHQAQWPLPKDSSSITTASVPTSLPPKSILYIIAFFTRLRQFQLCHYLGWYLLVASPHGPQSKI